MLKQATRPTRYTAWTESGPGAIKEADVEIWREDTIGTGAAATVFRIRSGPFLEFAAKIYKEHGRFNYQKISAMLDLPPQHLFVEHGGNRYPQFAWPMYPLFNTSKLAIGYLMPLAARGHTINHYIERDLAAKLPPVQTSLAAKVHISRNLAALLADLNGHQHHVIDFKPQNIHVYNDAGFVAILDCDSFSILGANGERFPATEYTSEYICPEELEKPAGPASLGENQDRFALAVTLFQILNNGLHPFQGIIKAGDVAGTTDEKVRRGLYPYGLSPNPLVGFRPDSVHACFDDGTRLLFDRAFAHAPNQRPSAAEWRDHLHALIATRALQTCNKNATHQHFSGKPCPTCQFSDALRRMSEAAERSQRRAPPLKSDAGPRYVSGKAQPPRRGIRKRYLYLTLALLILPTLGLWFVAVDEIEFWNDTRKLDVLTLSEFLSYGSNSRWVEIKDVYLSGVMSWDPKYNGPAAGGELFHLVLAPESYERPSMTSNLFFFSRSYRLSSGWQPSVTGILYRGRHGTSAAENAGLDLRWAVRSFWKKELNEGEAIDAGGLATLLVEDKPPTGEDVAIWPVIPAFLSGIMLWIGFYLFKRGRS